MPLVSPSTRLSSTFKASSLNEYKQHVVKNNGKTYISTSSPYRAIGEIVVWIRPETSLVGPALWLDLDPDPATRSVKVGSGS